MENFGEWLKKQIETKKISQKELSQMSGVTPAQISRIIGGTRGVGPDALMGISRALKLPPDLVFQKAGLLPPKTDDTPLERTILALVKSLPENEQATFLAMLETWQEKRTPVHKNAK